MSSLVSFHGVGEATGTVVDGLFVQTAVDGTQFPLTHPRGETVVGRVCGEIIVLVAHGTVLGEGATTVDPH